MRPSRRKALGWSLGALGLGVAGGVAGLRATARPRGTDESFPISIEAAPIASFSKKGSGQSLFGDLSFRSGLVLTSKEEGFGGLSGLWRDPNGRQLVAITDSARWLTATVTYAAGALTGLGGAAMAPVLGADGVSLWRTPAFDTESLAIADGVAYIGIERVHEVRRFEWARDGVRAAGLPLGLPEDARALPRNGGLEALAVAPPGHPLAGALVAIAEESRPGEDTPTRGWVLTGPEPFGFDVARSADFDITDAAFLPSGELLLLERRYSPLRGVACRMRRIARDAIRPNAMLDGRIIFEADDAFEIDNMEGLSVHADPVTGATILTLLSDDNYSILQRTLLLEFALAG